MDGYQRLASAIVAQGIEDYYKSGIKALLFIHQYLSATVPNKKDHTLKQFEQEYLMVKECENFLLSGYFTLLTDLDGPTLYKKLNKRISEYGNERIFK